MIDTKEIVPIMIRVKDRPLPINGQRVKVYVNLHKRGLFSVIDMKTGLVVAYSPTVLIHNAVFHVGESGRKRTVQESIKRVHAWVKGAIVTDIIGSGGTDHLKTEVNYDPFKYEHFTRIGTGEEVTTAKEALCFGKRVYIEGGKS